MKKFYVNYNTGAGDFYAETLEKAKAEADEGNCYTQKDVEIYADWNGENERLVAKRVWCGVEYDAEGDGYEEDPVCYGNYGYYTSWIDM